MLMALDELKQKAIEAGYNLSGETFQFKDWPVLNGFLLFKYGIKTDYYAVMRDLTSGAVPCFKPSLKFENNTCEQPVAFKYSYGRIIIHAGMNLHTTEQIAIESNATVEIPLDGKWTPVTSFSYEYKSQDSSLPFRFIPQQTGNSIKFSSPTLKSTYLFIALPFKEEERTPAICAKAICGLTVVGDDK